MDWKEKIVSDKAILAEKPVIKGTRLSVEFPLGLFANGWNEEAVLKIILHQRSQIFWQFLLSLRMSLKMGSSLNRSFLNDKTSRRREFSACKCRHLSY